MIVSSVGLNLLTAQVTGQDANPWDELQYIVGL